MTFEDSILWMQKLIDSVSDNARWGIPRCDTVYRIDKTNKTFHREIGLGDMPTEEVLAAMEWKVQ